jgi:cbb3-type cytochrome c oxidase subunit III
MKQSRVHLAAVALLVSVLAPALAQPPQPAARARDIAIKVCSQCHGPGGDGGNPQFPKLAAQQPRYLEDQLRAFRAHERAEPEAQHYMWGAASRDIDEGLIAAVASYFASQPAPRGRPGDPALIAKGKQLFQEGSPQKQIPACASCHGAEAKGNGVFPRLAGQHEQYLLKQLRLIQTAVRKAPVMHGIIEHLDDADMRAVAAYLQSLD